MASSHKRYGLWSTVKSAGEPRLCPESSWLFRHEFPVDKLVLIDESFADAALVCLDSLLTSPPSRPACLSILALRQRVHGGTFHSKTASKTMIRPRAPSSKQYLRFSAGVSSSEARSTAETCSGHTTTHHQFVGPSQMSYVGSAGFEPALSSAQGLFSRGLKPGPD